MYSLKNILKQEPNKVRTAVLSGLGLLVIFQVINISVEAVAAAGMFLDQVLSLFYVGPLTSSNDKLSELSKK